MNKILKFLYELNADDYISDETILEAYDEILEMKDKEKSNICISTLFTYLMLKRKDPQLITKLLKMSFKRDKLIPFYEKMKNTSKYPVISLSGSGKKGIKTINISTASAIVAVSLGANILKPCSTATSSQSGSYDFLNMVGVNTDVNIENTKKLLNKTGFGIFPIEKLIPKFDYVYGDVFYAPNILSFGLAALICPIKPDIVLYGLANDGIEICGPILNNFGIEKYRIVSSKENNKFIDELNVFGTSSIINNNEKRKKYNFQKILNLPTYSDKDIKQFENKKQNIKQALDVLSGNSNNAYEDIIALNSGNILQLSGITKTIEEGYYISKEKIRTGDCIQTLEKIIIESGGDVTKLYKIMEG